ncbi:tetratricopeptide repeat protein [Fulvivirgaceae bacterium PWU4]|uniref:Tetratricopeptide repeat protein n=1 Tax=Chryseosolibacter histidini TaxID=2782349 RepID=A0AAP2GSG8_9BACT|nr:tetratricopeptide repeat protein [Chryseosolibacter histidini]MBT1700672.1 tetratricopeptide repeat protein [Chryseosolibacter histidini]
MKAIIISLLVCLTGYFPQTENAGPDAETYSAYLGSRDVETTKARWKKIVADRKVRSEAAPENTKLLYELTLAQFGLLTATQRDRDEDLFDDYVEETEANLETLIDRNKNSGEPRALLAALYGMRMSYSPMKGMFLGAKSESLMDQALKRSPASPLVWKLHANAKFFTPETWGGDLKEAITAYEKAVALYESAPDKGKDNWFYIDTLAFLGKAYEKNNQNAKAIEVYKKALSAEPDYQWVKSVLLPRVMKSTSPQ